MTMGRCRALHSMKIFSYYYYVYRHHHYRCRHYCCLDYYCPQEEIPNRLRTLCWYSPFRISAPELYTQDSGKPKSCPGKLGFQLPIALNICNLISLNPQTSSYKKKKSPKTPQDSLIHVMLAFLQTSASKPLP